MKVSHISVMQHVAQIVIQFVIFSKAFYMADLLLLFPTTRIPRVSPFPLAVDERWDDRQVQSSQVATLEQTAAAILNLPGPKQNDIEGCSWKWI